MVVKRKRGNEYSSDATHQNEYPDGYIITLRPEGSLDAIVPSDRRKLVRPEINYRIVTFNVVVFLLIFIAVCWWSMRYALLGGCVYVLFRLHKIVIWSIRVYQRYAPEHIRAACVFEPSCSEYMILAIEKYGVIRGSIKGVKRLRRCHNPNRGEDYP